MPRTSFLTRHASQTCALPNQKGALCENDGGRSSQIRPPSVDECATSLTRGPHHRCPVTGTIASRARQSYPTPHVRKRGLLETVAIASPFGVLGRTPKSRTNTGPKKNQDPQNTLTRKTSTEKKKRLERHWLQKPLVPK